MVIGPAAEAVVTVRDASLKTRISAPWFESTVCTRLSGATRLSISIQPDRVWIAVGVTSQRWMR